MELAWGCPSTGWMYCFGAAHALVAALFGSGDLICPMTILPAALLNVRLARSGY
jgi:3-hydroxy-9,10-secoandrosta-1,3,5(10)-triene-9,17-dione monooxygenase